MFRPPDGWQLSWATMQPSGSATIQWCLHSGIAKKDSETCPIYSMLDRNLTERCVCACRNLDLSRRAAWMSLQALTVASPR